MYIYIQITLDWYISFLTLHADCLPRLSLSLSCSLVFFGCRYILVTSHDLQSQIKSFQKNVCAAFHNSFITTLFFATHLHTFFEILSRMVNQTHVKHFNSSSKKYHAYCILHIAYTALKIC